MTIARAREAVRAHVRRVATFLIVGVGGAVVDLGVFNGLVYWGGSGPLSDHPVPAKIMSTVVATGVTYVGNGMLTYRDQSSALTRRGVVAYAAINVGAIAIQAACLGISRYVLGLEGPLADNLSGTGVGLVLATTFRYVAYPRWVFTDAGSEF